MLQVPPHTEQNSHQLPTLQPSYFYNSCLLHLASVLIITCCQMQVEYPVMMGINPGESGYHQGSEASARCMCMATVRQQQIKPIREPPPPQKSNSLDICCRGIVRVLGAGRDVNGTRAFKCSIRACSRSYNTSIIYRAASELITLPSVSAQHQARC